MQAQQEIPKLGIFSEAQPVFEYSKMLFIEMSVRSLKMSVKNQFETHTFLKLWNFLHLFASLSPMKYQIFSIILTSVFFEYMYLLYTF